MSPMDKDTAPTRTLTYDVTRTRTIVERGTITVEVPNEVFLREGEGVIAHRAEQDLSGYYAYGNGRAAADAYALALTQVQDITAYTVNRGAHETRTGVAASAAPNRVVDRGNA